MEQQWCDLELGARRELAGLKDAEWAVSNELVQMQWTPDTEQFLLTYQLLSDEIWQGHCFGIALSAPHFTPFLYSPLEIPRPTVSGLPSMRRWALPMGCSSLSGLSFRALLYREGRQAWQVLTYPLWQDLSGAVAMCFLDLPWNTEKTGWTEIWWKGQIANRWKLFSAFYFNFGFL